MYLEYILLLAGNGEWKVETINISNSSKNIRNRINSGYTADHVQRYSNNVLQDKWLAKCPETNAEDIGSIYLFLTTTTITKLLAFTAYYIR